MGLRSIFFPSCIWEWWLVLPSCTDSPSNFHGLPSRKEQTCIGTTSLSTKSEYVPIVKCTCVVLVTLSLWELPNHWM
jgi:hypothetical protein